MRSSLFALLFALLLLGGCHTTQVRHLASDASLVKPGQTTVQEVRKYLGEPDGQREVSPGITEFVYYQDRPGLFGTAPVLGSMTGPTGYEMIVITIANNVVTNCDFRSFNESDRKWMSDYTWDQKIK